MMSAEKKLLDLLRTRQQASSPTVREVIQAKQWIADVESLMVDIKKWLRGAEKEGLVRVKSREVTLVEPKAGKYNLPALTLTTPGYARVLLDPAGLEVIGAKGRVDLASGPKKVMLLRFAPKHWHFTWPANQPGEWESERLTEESFYKVLRWLIE